jgi:hypothetical protein
VGYLRNDWPMKVEDAEFRRPLTPEEEEFRRLNTPCQRSKPQQAQQLKHQAYNARRHTCR